MSKDLQGAADQSSAVENRAYAKPPKPPGCKDTGC